MWTGKRPCPAAELDRHSELVARKPRLSKCSGQRRRLPTQPRPVAVVKPPSYFLLLRSIDPFHLYGRNGNRKTITGNKNFLFLVVGKVRFLTEMIFPR